MFWMPDQVRHDKFGLFTISSYLTEIFGIKYAFILGMIVNGLVKDGNVNFVKTGIWSFFYEA